MNQRGWRTDEIDARIKGIEAASEENQEEGLYATYAMLYTYTDE